MCAGAILTQNTNWNNAEKALRNLIEVEAMDAGRIACMNLGKLEKLVKPSGFFRQKAGRLKEFSRFVLSFGSLENFLKNVTRKELLVVNGIGMETADSILLYACGKPYFVIDAYTKRLVEECGIDEKGYESLRKLFESRLPKDVELYREFHALIVIHGKRNMKSV